MSNTARGTSGTGGPTTRRVFISHAHADNALCDRYVAALRAQGVDVWYDRTNLQSGTALSAEIERELQARTAFVVVVLLSPAAVASYWVRLEIDAYRALATRDSARLVVPVRIAPCEVPVLLRGLL
jgi:TIR domain